MRNIGLYSTLIRMINKIELFKVNYSFYTMRLHLVNILIPYHLMMRTIYGNFHFSKSYLL